MHDIIAETTLQMKKRRMRIKIGEIMFGYVTICEPELEGEGSEKI